MGGMTKGICQNALHISVWHWFNFRPRNRKWFVLFYHHTNLFYSSQLCTHHTLIRDTSSTIFSSSSHSLSLSFAFAPHFLWFDVSRFGFSFRENFRHFVIVLLAHYMSIWFEVINDPDANKFVTHPMLINVYFRCSKDIVRFKLHANQNSNEIDHLDSFWWIFWKSTWQIVWFLSNKMLFTFKYRFCHAILNQVLSLCK